MNFNEAELPTQAQGVDLEEIGFKKPEGPACIPLLVKSLYTVMFWITLRQYMQEKMEKRQTSALADMVAPLQVTVGAAGNLILLVRWRQFRINYYSLGYS